METARQRLREEDPVHPTDAMFLRGARTILASLLLLPALHAQALLPIQDGQTIPLWPGAAPGALGTEEPDVPSITAYFPRSVAGPLAAAIICPGGGYRNLAMNHEGRQVANYLNSLGMAAFVLKYRLGPRYHHPVELADVQRAMRLVRSRAADWHIAADRIGIVGFSAGGHLAAMASNLFDAHTFDAKDAIDRENARPDFAVLGYPVISMVEPWTHRGSRDNLLGENAPATLEKSLSGEQLASARTPPTFIFQTNADTTVPAENSIYYAIALRKAGVPVEMHLFENGPHGVGLALNDVSLSEWPKLLSNWLRLHGWLR